MSKLYESDSSIVYRGFNKKIIDEHLNSKLQKVLCVYDTKENLLCNELNYESMYLALYEILTETSDEFIIKRHTNLDKVIDKIKNKMQVEYWKPIAGIKTGSSIKLKKDE